MTGHPVTRNCKRIKRWRTEGTMYETICVQRVRDQWKRQSVGCL